MNRTCTVEGCEAKPLFAAEHCKHHENEVLRESELRAETPSSAVATRMHLAKPIKVWQVEWDRYYRHHRAEVDGTVLKGFTHWGTQRKAMRYIRARNLR